MLNNLDDKNHGLTGPRSVLNVDAQKELIDFTIKKNMKMMLIAFPVVMIFMLGIIYVVFTFVMNMTRR
ncbi:MAG TPA: hypothetical protein PLJ58_00055 [bacterium]|jgi:hypothetical protein|nr:hypothetical protein [bacterium]